MVWGIWMKLHYPQTNPERPFRQVGKVTGGNCLEVLSVFSLVLLDRALGKRQLGDNLAMTLDIYS